MQHPTILKRLLLAWVFLLLILCSLAYWYYKNWQRDVQKSDFLPHVLTSSAFVLDLPAIGTQWDTFQKTAIGQHLCTLPLANHMREILGSLQKAGIDTSVVKELPVVISIHGLSREEIGYLLYVDLRIPKVATLVNALERSGTSHQYEVELRNYEGYTINTINLTYGKSSTKCYMLQHQHYAMISFSAILLEDVIRGWTHKDPAAFLKLQQATHKQGSLFVNFAQLPSLLRVFLTQKVYAQWAPQLDGIKSQAHLELKLTDHYLFFNGLFNKEIPFPPKPYWLQDVPSEGASSFGLAAYIPAGTAIVQHYAVHDASRLAKEIQPYHDQHTAPMGKEQELIQETVVSPAILHTLIKNEVALCTLGTESHQQVLFVEVHNIEEAIETLEEAQCMADAPGLRFSHFSTIYQVNPTILKTWLPLLMFPSFTPKFLVTVDHCLIVVNSLAALQALEESYQQGTTWVQEGSAQHEFLTSTLETATCSMFVDMQALHRWMAPHLKPMWKNIWDKQLAKFCEHGYASFQVKNQGTHEQPLGYINVLLAHVGQEEAALTQIHTTQGPSLSNVADPTSVAFFEAEAPIQTPPLWVVTHKQEGSLLLVQDALHQLYLVRSTGQLIWKKQLEGPILPEVLAVDMYKNNKWQYVCATATALHVIDYTGNEVDNFPCQLLAKGLGTAVNIVDYNGDKNYRFLITDESGNIYLKDMQYRPLPGWNPNPLLKPFAMTPLHLRVDKDYFIVLQENGMLNIINRRGQSYAGFPINVGEAVHNPLVIQTAQQAVHTRLIILTDTGKLYTYNLQGSLQSSVQLNKTSSVGKFTLVPDQVDKQHYVIFQQEMDKLIVWDEQGQVLFEKPWETDQTLVGQYYNYESYPLYLVTDVEKEKTYIYDKTGKLVHVPLRNSGYPIQLFWTEPSQRLTAYTTVGNQVHSYQLDVLTLASNTQ